MDANEARLYIGEVVGARYEIVEFRGKGNFSGVFRGRDLQSGQDVAVKVLSLGSSRDQSAVFEFQEDARLLRMLGGRSNIVDILDNGTLTLQLQVQGAPAPVGMAVPYMVLEFAAGGLDMLLLRRDQIAWIDRLMLFRSAVKGVHQMHCQWMVHRDIKADNVLLFDRGEVKAKITDLGRSRNTREAPRFAAQYEVPRGALAFAPPELLWLQGTDEPLDGLRGDLYLIGSLLFEIAAGVGITSVALGNPHAIINYARQLSASNRAREYQSRLPDMREQYERAYRVFENECPRAIAHEATELVRQLTDPDPACREPRRPFRNLPTRWDLNWLLQKADILIKRLAASQRRPRRYRRSRKVVPKS